MKNSHRPKLERWHVGSNGHVLKIQGPRIDCVTGEEFDGVLFDGFVGEMETAQLAAAAPDLLAALDKAEGAVEYLSHDHEGWDEILTEVRAAIKKAGGTQ